MTQNETKIFFTGATGYIGASVLQRLLAHKKRDEYEITALVRNAASAKILEDKFGVRTVTGSYAELDTLEKMASEADIVISIADADNLAAANAILAGLKKRHAVTGTVPLLIHTSGTGVFTDKADGQYASDDIYSDLDVECFEQLSPTALHRNVDSAIAAADAEGYLRSYIILPTAVFGLGHGPIYDAGIANRHSVLLPGAIRHSVERGRAAMVGSGKNIWACIHVDDVAELYIVLLDVLRTTPEKPGHGREGYYIVENGEFAVIDSTREIGRVLFQLGKVSTAEPDPYTEEEITKWFGGWKVMGSNSRSKAERSRQLGWTPTKTTEDLFASIQPEVNAILKK